MFVRRRKYLLTIVAFVVIVGFLDDNSLVRRLEYAREAAGLNSEIERYRTEYNRATEQLKELAVDTVAIERVAREKYYMKRPNEDIYLFKEDRRK
jgi:cell division protein FtsB